MRSDLYEIRKIGPEFHYALYSPLQCFIFFSFFFFLKRLLRLLPLLVWEGDGAERPAFNPAHPPTPEALTHFLFKYAFIFSSRLRGRVHFLK